MKTKTIIVVLIILLATVGVYYYIRKKQNPGKNPFQSALDKIFGPGHMVANNGGGYSQSGSAIIPHSGVVPKGASDKDFFRSLGFGDAVLNKLSVKDAKDARYYIEHFLRKGFPIGPGKFFNDIKRIAEYSGLFAVPTWKPDIGLGI